MNLSALKRQAQLPTDRTQSRCQNSNRECDYVDTKELLERVAPRVLPFKVPSNVPELN